MECDGHQDLSAVAFDHAQQPRNNGPLADFSGHARITGPCGDTMEFWLLIRDRKIEKASFITDGCGPSYACGSMATCLIEGKGVEEAATLTEQAILDALGDLPAGHRHCALLAANTLKAACEDSMENRRSQPLEPDPNQIAHKILVLSGKGGVGKSSVAVNLAVWLSLQGRQVGLLDADIHGPSVPKLLAISDRKAAVQHDRIIPIAYSDHLKVMSIGFLLPNENEAIIWRGPMKHNLIQQFIQNVDWGRLDYLVVDCPPGTGDEPLSVVQTLGSPDGAVVVTTPQEIAAIDVRKCITFCRQLGLPVLGIIENMSGFVCPHCGKSSDIFAGSSGREMAHDFKAPFLGSIPIDPQLGAAADRGKPFVNLDPDNPAAQAMRRAFEPLLALCQQSDPTKSNSERESSVQGERNDMKIAIPLAAGKLSAHFGHCEQFAIVDVDRESKTIKGQDLVTPPAHEPGVLPAWLSGLNVNVVIAGGMGQRAQGLFTARGIQVIVGAPAETPDKLVADYLAGTLQVGDNVCDH